MADTEQDVVVSSGNAGDWLSDAMDKPAQAAEPVTSDPQPTGESAPVETSEPSGVDPVETSGSNRDERGRFKPKDAASAAPKVETEPAPTQEQQPVTAEAPVPASKEDRDGWIPSWRAREISEGKRAAAERADRAEADAKAAAAKWEQAQRETAELKKRIDDLTKPKPEPVNLFENPDAFVGSVDEKLSAWERKLDERERKLRLENNLAISAIIHKDEFPSAYEAFVKAVEAGDKATATRVFNSTDPGGSMVAWHRERKTLTEIGGDPNAYIQRKLEEALNDPAFLAKAVETAKAKATGQPAAQPGAPATRPNNVVKRPPSLSGVPGGQSAHAGGVGSSGDWLNEAMGR